MGTAAEDHVIALWTLHPEHRLLAAIELGVCPTAVTVSPDGQTIAVGLADGGLLLLGMGSDGHGVVLRETGGAPMSRTTEGLIPPSVTALAYSPDGAYLAAGSADGKLTLSSVRSGFSKRVALKASGRNKDGIVALDFSTDGSWLRASTANHAAQHWDVSGGVELDEGALVLRDETWQTWTSAVGWNVTGIWHGLEQQQGSTAKQRGGQQGERASASKATAAQSSVGQVVVDANSECTLVAVGAGPAVKLFRYPCYEKRAEARVLSAHGGTVSAVRFSADGGYIVSAGDDQAIMVFETKQKKESP